MKEIKINDIKKGVVISIKKYGAFISFDDNYLGLLHISEISSNFISDIFNYFKIGDYVTCKVIKIDKEKKFLSLSLKGLDNNINNLKDINPTKKITSYIKEIDFSKLEKSLPSMINKELNRENNI